MRKVRLTAFSGDTLDVEVPDFIPAYTANVYQGTTLLGKSIYKQTNIKERFVSDYDIVKEVYLKFIKQPFLEAPDGSFYLTNSIVKIKLLPKED